MHAQNVMHEQNVDAHPVLGLLVRARLRQQLHCFPMPLTCSMMQRRLTELPPKDTPSLRTPLQPIYIMLRLVSAHASLALHRL
eukprot:265520-Rhodomonas_salina.1